MTETLVVLSRFYEIVRMSN